MCLYCVYISNSMLLELVVDDERFVVRDPRMHSSNDLIRAKFSFVRNQFVTIDLSTLRLIAINELNLEMKTLHSLPIPPVALKTRGVKVP